MASNSNNTERIFYYDLVGNRTMVKSMLCYLMVSINGENGVDVLPGEDGEDGLCGGSGRKGGVGWLHISIPLQV